MVRGVEDYPRTLQELEARFATEQACREYLARLRWGQGFVCPACDGTEAWPTGRGLWMCTACGHQASVLAGTIFQGTRTPLPLWFRAIWWVVGQKNGASALGLQRVLGLGMGSVVSISTTTSTSSPFASIDALHAIAGSSSIGFWSRPWRCVRCHTRPWSRGSVAGRRNATTACSSYLSTGNTLITANRGDGRERTFNQWSNPVGDATVCKVDSAPGTTPAMSLSTVPVA